MVDCYSIIEVARAAPTDLPQRQGCPADLLRIWIHSAETVGRYGTVRATLLRKKW